MDRWKAEQGRGREKRKIRRKKSRRERVRRKMEMREKVGKSRNTVFFQWFGAPEGRKVGSLKRRVRSQLARWEMKSCTPLWREADFQVKMYKTHQLRTTFGSWDVKKVHTVVARSTFWSQNVQNTPGPDHFWKLRCRKSARRCGAKHISKSKCAKHTSIGPLLEVEMSKKCTPLWREAHFQVKMYKTPCSRHFWKFGCWKSARRCGAKHISKSKCTKHHMFMFAPLLEVQMSLRFTTLHYITLHSTTLRSTTLHYITQHYNYTTTLHYTPLHYITLHYTPLHYTTLHYTTLPSTTLHYITLHSTTLQPQLQLHNYTPLQYTPLHSTTLNYTTLHSTPLHYTTLHYTTLPSTTLHYITLHYTTSTTTTTQLHSTIRYYTTLHYITLHYTTFHYTPLHYTTLHYTTIHWMTLHHR